MLKHVSNSVLPLALITTSLALSACSGGSGTEDPAIGAASENPSQIDSPDGDAQGDNQDASQDQLNPDNSNDNDSPQTPSSGDSDNTNDNDSADETPDDTQSGAQDTNSTDTDSTDTSDNSTDDADSDAGTDTEDEEQPLGKQVAPPVIAGASAAVVTPNESDPFSKFQLDDSLYTNNVYDGRQLDPDNNWKLIFYDGVQDFVRWQVPAILEDNASPCARPHSGEPISLSYRLTSRKDSPHERNTFVRSYPAMVVGSMGGRYESWGVECGQVDTILPSVQRHGGSPVYQMETVAAATGLPVLVSDLDYDVRVSVKADINTAEASPGIANVFMDSYWHNVSDVALVPGNEAQLVDTINGISSDYTEVWNLNIWFDYPRFEGSASSWTGGFDIGSVTLAEGGEFDIYFKIEGSRDGHLPRCRLGTNVNCFLYIGLVATDENAARNGITVNYTEIAEWMQSADFRDLFLTGAFETDTPAAKAFEAWQMIDGTDNDNHPDPAKRGPRFPDQNHVVGGIHLGAELWYNPDAVPATIEFEALGVEVEGIGQFGNYANY